MPRLRLQRTALGTRLRWSAPQDVDSTSMQTNGLSGVSCPSATECVAVGQDAAGSEGVVSVGTETTTASGSSWSWNPEAISNTYNLLGVSCPSTSFCMAVGQASNGGAAIAVPLSVSGTSATAGADVDLSSPASADSYSSVVSCPSTTECIALDFYANSQEEAVILSSGSSGTFAPTESVEVPGSTLSPPTYLFGLDCPTTSECVGDGEANYGGSPQSYGIVTTLSYSSANATWSWGTAQEPSSGTVTPIGLVGIACPTASDCVAVGAASGGLVATTTTADGGTSWSTPDLFSSPMGFDSVACSTQQDCVAVTPYDSQTSGPASSATSTDGGQSWIGYQPVSCVYGTPGSNNGTCTFSSSDTLFDLGNASPLSLQPSTVADPGVLVEVSTELASSSTSDEGATATVPFSFTATA